MDEQYIAVLDLIVHIFFFVYSFAFARIVHIESVKQGKNSMELKDIILKNEVFVPSFIHSWRKYHRWDLLAQLVVFRTCGYIN